LRGPRVARIHRGAYVCSGVTITLRTRVDAALLLLPEGTAASHVTGLQLRGIDVGPRLPLHFSSTHPHRARLPDVRMHRCSTLPRPRDGMLSAERCFVEAASELGLLEAVVAGDWLVHTRHSDLGRLNREVATAAGSRGVVAAREALALVRPRVESPRETRLRLMLVLAGLPEPQINVDVRQGRRFVARPDLLYPAPFKVVVEYEGRQHADDSRQWNRDIDRYDDLAAAGWRVYRVTAERMREPREVVRRVHAMLVAAGYRGPRPRFDGRWSQLFEQ
jgi:hypothetical protein